MNIETVKIQGENYLLNDSMSVPKAEGNRHYSLIQEWIAQGNTPEPEFTPEEIQQNLVREVSSKVQQHLDSKAQELGYDSIFTAVTYADEGSVPSFQTEGQALRAWRSNVWAKCYELLEAGQELTAEEVINQLPVFAL